MRLMNSPAAFCAAMALLAAASAEGAERFVDGPAGLVAALARAEAGDRLVLAGGAYGDLALAGRQWSSPVSIAAADARDPPRFRSVRLTDVRGLTFDGVVIARGGAEAPLQARAADLLRTDMIAFRNVEILGSDNADPADDPFGVFVRDSRGFSLVDCKLHDLYRGLAIHDSADWRVADSVFRRMASDGIVGRGAVGAAIEGNLFTDFATDLASGVHPDAVQFWDRGARQATRGLVIARNAVLRGAGGPSQGVFINGENPMLAATGLVIEDNVIHQSMGQGILVKNVNGAVIRRNTVAPFDPSRDAPGIEARRPFADVTMADNLAASFRTGGMALAASNILLDYDNPWNVGYAEQLLADPRSGADAAASDFRKLSDAAPFAIRSERIHGDDESLRFSVWDGAGATQWRFRGPGDAEFGNWTQGDGLGRSFASPGLAMVEARRVVGGRTETARKRVRIFERNILALAPERGVATFGPDPKWSGMARLDIALRLRSRGDTRAWRYILSAPGAYDLRVKGDTVLFSVSAGGETTRLAAPIEGLAQGAHDLRFLYDGQAGAVEIHDGARLVTRAEAPSGAIAYRKTATLHVGGAPFGPAFEGEIERLEIRR